jgi:hypothetical protein
MSIMSCVKKIYKSELFWEILVLTLLVIGVFGLSCKKNKEKTLFLTQPKIYQWVKKDSSLKDKKQLDLEMTNDELCEIKVFENHQDSYYLNDLSLSSMYLMDESESNKMLVEVKKVTQDNSSLIYQEKKFYEYSISFLLPLQTSEVYTIKEAYAEFVFVNGERVRLPLGEVNYISESESSEQSDITLSNLKGIVNSIDDVSFLTGVQFTFRAEEKLVISKIETICDSVWLQKQNYVVLQGKLYEENTPMDTILKKKYLLEEKNTNALFNLSLSKGESVTLVIPVGYLKQTPIQELGFILYYQEQGQEKQRIISPFCFYQSSTIQPIYQLTTYELD